MPTELFVKNFFLTFCKKNKYDRLIIQMKGEDMP